MEKHYVITNGKTRVFNSETAKEKNKEYHEAMRYSVDESLDATRLLVAKGLAVTEDFKKLEDAGEIEKKVDVKKVEKKVKPKEVEKEKSST